jgi:hypothetical protein
MASRKQGLISVQNYYLQRVKKYFELTNSKLTLHSGGNNKVSYKKNLKYDKLYSWIITFKASSEASQIWEILQQAIPGRKRSQ